MEKGAVGLMAFYAWTDTLILNMCNTKATYFSDKKATLFVLKMPRLSSELIESVKKYHVFDDIFEIELPLFELVKGKPLSLREKLDKLLAGRRLKNYYFGEYRKHVGDRKYTKLFTGAFWANTLFLYRYLSETNQDLNIELVEEGLANYNSSIVWDFKCLPTVKKTELLMRYMYFMRVWKRAKANTIRKYIYHPGFANTAHDMDIVQLPQISNGVCREILELSGKNIDMSEYNSRRVFFFAGLELYEHYISRFMNILTSVQDVASAKDILLKIHPTFKKLEINTCSDVFVDRRNYFFEAAVCSIDIEEKIFVVLHSTLPLMLKNTTQCEPVIIITYKLYNLAHEFEIEECKAFVTYIRELYIRPDKIYVPENLDELKAILLHHMVDVK